MAIDEAAVSAGPGETRIALLEAGRVVEFAIDRGGAGLGDVIEGRVVGRAGGAAFVAIGEGTPGYLARPGGAAEGDSLLVEVTCAARPGKGAVLKRAAAGTVPVRRSALARALAANSGIRRVAIDDAAALAEARSLFATAELRPDAFEESGAADALEEALAPSAALPGGASLHFAETPAATLIDVDAGGSSPAEANARAIGEAARQLRLRGIGGHVLIDAIPGRDRRALPRLIADLRAAAAEDPMDVQVAGATPLGMIELTRRRTGPSLAEMLLTPESSARSPLTLALEGLRALLREARMRPRAPQTLALSPPAAAALRAHAGALAEAGRRLGRRVELVERPGVAGYELAEQR